VGSVVFSVVVVVFLIKARVAHTWDGRCLAMWLTSLVRFGISLTVVETITIWDI